jgi:hypothetical protein
MADEKKGIEILFEDESLQDLSEDFKTKATVIFETAVAKGVSEEKQALEEEYETKLEESKKEIAEQLEEQVDSYLTYVVEEWVEENKLAIDAGIKTEIAEHFMSGMKELFEESYVEVPENKIDVVAEMTEQLETKENELNDAVTENIKLTSELKDFRKAFIVSEETDGLADSEIDKIESFIEMVDYDDEDSYRSQIKSIVEAYTGKSDDKDKDDDADDDKKKDKKDNDDDADDETNESVNFYASAISKGSTKF